MSNGKGKGLEKAKEKLEKAKEKIEKLKGNGVRFKIKDVEIVKVDGSVLNYDNVEGFNQGSLFFEVMISKNEVIGIKTVDISSYKVILEQPKDDDESENEKNED